MRVERVEGGYREPEIVDLEDGTGCLFKLHESDIDEDGAVWLGQLLTEQARRWAPRLPGMPLGPAIPVVFERVPGLPDPIAVRLEDGADRITYTVDESIVSEHAAVFLGNLLTARSPYWRRVPRGFHEGHGRLGDAV